MPSSSTTVVLSSWFVMKMRERVTPSSRLSSAGSLMKYVISSGIVTPSMSTLSRYVSRDFNQHLGLEFFERPEKCKKKPNYLYFIWLVFMFYSDEMFVLLLGSFGFIHRWTLWRDVYLVYAILCQYNAWFPNGIGSQTLFCQVFLKEAL